MIFDNFLLGAVILVPLVVMGSLLATSLVRVNEGEENE